MSLDTDELERVLWGVIEVGDVILYRARYKTVIRIEITNTHAPQPYRKYYFIDDLDMGLYTADSNEVIRVCSVRSLEKE